MIVDGNANNDKDNIKIIMVILIIIPVDTNT